MSTRMKSPVGPGPGPRPRPRQLKSSTTSSSSRRSPSAVPDDYYEASRVRVSVRVRPRNQEEEVCDAPDCVELHPELNKLTLTKNNWSCESYRFDQVFPEATSQKRVYDAVARPVVESVLNGHNGTVMAYGQTGTGKTYTVGALGKEDPSQCGIMVRAMKHILSTPTPLTVHVSYLQLYLESLQDLLLPHNNNIPILEHPRTGQLSLPAAALIKVEDLDHFLQLLQIGDSNRHAANSKLNTQSSRSHAILVVYIRMPSQGKTENHNQAEMLFPISTAAPTLIQSKLLIVDLAGSERIDKSGSEGHMLEEAKFINLSLTSLGKCIHAIAENSPHIPTRDSKLTRLLRDSFGGSARTSLIITIGPSARNHAETSSTIMFGQRAMKIVNMLKLKEEFDYEGLCRKLENQVDYLTAELERQQKLSEDDRVELDRKLRECHNSFIAAEKTQATKSELLHKDNTRLESEIKSVLVELKLQRDHNDLLHDEVAKMEMSLKQSKQSHLENSTYQKVLAETTQMYEKKIAELIEELENKHAHSESVQEQLNVVNKILSDHQNSIQERYELHEKTVKECQSLRAENEKLSLEKIQIKKKIDELEHKLHELGHLYENILKEFRQSKSKNEKLLPETDGYEVDRLRIELQEMHELYEKTIHEFQSLQTEHNILLSQKETMSGELRTLERRLSIKEKERKYLEDAHAKHLKHGFENDGYCEDGRQNLNGIIGNVLGSPRRLLNLQKPRETLFSQRATVAKIINEVGLPKIVSMLSSEDVEVQKHAVKVVANLAAEDENQETIVEEGGLEALLMLLGSSTNATIHRVGSGAIANLAMNEINQGLIMSKGGAQLLANIAFNSDDPQTLRMVAGAIANLCGNQKLHVMLRDDGGIKALFKMVQSGNNDVVAQVARGIANFAKCESRGTIYGHRKGKSLLLEDGTLTWLVGHSTSTSTSTRRHIELALCHLGQNEENAQDFIYSGALKELVRISCQSSKEDIRSLAKKILKLNPTFQSEMQRV